MMTGDVMINIAGVNVDAVGYAPKAVLILSIAQSISALVMISGGANRMVSVVGLFTQHSHMHQFFADGSGAPRGAFNQFHGNH